MKRLDLSCLPINLEVGETMEVIDHEGKYHLIKCVQVKNGFSSCEGCFFTKTANTFSCTQIRCSGRERGENVRYIELPVENEFKQDEESEMKTLTIQTLNETKRIKAGETFIYVDDFDKQHKIIAKPVGVLNISEACGGCVFNNDACCSVDCSKAYRESKDDVYFEELSFEEPFKP